MKRDESVFFFTLVDFLLTALFLGVVLYVLAESASAADVQRQAETQRALAEMRAATGISDIRELTDRLTRLGPVRDAETGMEAIRSIGCLLYTSPSPRD